jgi:hypothetical protein
MAASLVLALLFVSCGGSATPHGNNSARRETSPTPEPHASATASQTTAGQVTLTLSKQHYATDEPLLVTIHNGLQTSIWVRDGRAGCTSLIAERLVQGTWEPVGQCTPASVSSLARLIAIAPGGALTQRLDAAQGMDTGAGWPASTYRVLLQYGLDGTAGAVSDGPTTYSPEFTIG